MKGNSKFNIQVQRRSFTGKRPGLVHMFIRCIYPNIVSMYNKSMGGVDLLDSLALYPIKIRSKKWYHCIVFHMLDLILVES